MDQQRPLLYLTLVFLGFMIWSAWQQDHAPKPQAQANSNTSASANSQSASSTGAADVPQQAASDSDSSVPQSTTSTVTSGSIIKVKTDTLQFEINTRGGDIEQVGLPTYPVSIDEPDVPVIILDRAKQYSAQSGLGHKKIAGQKSSDLAPNHYAVYSSPSNEYTLKDGEDTLIIPLTWTGPTGITVTKRFIFKRGEFLVSVEHEVKNQSNQLWSGFEYRQIRHGPLKKSAGGFGNVQSYIGPAFYDFDDGKYKYEKLKFSNFDDPDERLNKKIEGGWVAMLEHYFVSAWVPPQHQTNTFYSKYINNGDTPNYIMGLKTSLVDVAPGASHTFKSNFYVGPKIQEHLEKIAKGLDLTVDYGIFTVFSKPIFWLLKFMHGIFGNWGWAIIFVTITIKLIFFYPSAMSYKSMAKMKKLSPKMKEMQARYKNDPQAKQKAMMEFYRKEKINPLGGCLPMLIQIPVFMGLYWVLQESVELRQAPWIGWYKDLSVMDPFLVLPILMGASMWLQQKLNPPQMDPMQQKIFQWLPVVFTVMFLFFPAGLVLYWLVNNILSIAQQWYINKKIIGDS